MSCRIRFSSACRVSTWAWRESEERRNCRTEYRSCWFCWVRELQWALERAMEKAKALRWPWGLGKETD